MLVFKLQGFPIDISIPSRLHTPPRPHRFLVFYDKLIRTCRIDEALARWGRPINAMAWDPVIRGSLLIPSMVERTCEWSVALRLTSPSSSEDPFTSAPKGTRVPSEFSVAPETIALLQNTSQDGHPRERLWGEEWKKFLLLSRKPSIGLHFLDQCGWLRHPELAAFSRAALRILVGTLKVMSGFRYLHCFLDWMQQSAQAKERDDPIGIGPSAMTSKTGDDQGRRRARHISRP